MARSKMFSKIEFGYKILNDKAASKHALDCFIDMANCLSGLLFSDEDLIVALIEGAKLGIASRDGKLEKEEKKLIDKTFSRIWDGDTRILYPVISAKVTDKDYAIIEEMCNVSSELALKFLELVLGFAYVDGHVDEKVLNKMDNIFSKNLPDEFGKYFMGEFPVPYRNLHILKDKLVELIENDAQKRAFVYKKIKSFLEMSRCDVRHAIGNIRQRKAMMIEKSRNMRSCKAMS
jgi:hypothetical protein